MSADGPQLGPQQKPPGHWEDNEPEVSSARGL